MAAQPKITNPPHKKCSLLVLVLLLFVLFPNKSFAAKRLCIRLRHAPQITSKQTYAWFVHLLKQRGFCLRQTGTAPRNTLSLSIHWGRANNLTARQGKLRQRFTLTVKQNDAWQTARTAVQFVDYFLDYIIAHKTQRTQQLWKKAKAQLKQTPNTKTSQTPPTPPIPPPTRRPVQPPRKRPRPRKVRVIPRTKPLRRPPPKRRNKTRPIPRKRTPLQRTKPRPITHKPAQPDDVWVLSIGLTTSLSVPGYDGLTFGGGSSLSVAFHGWHIGAALHLQASPPNTTRSLFLFHPQLEFAPPKWAPLAVLGFSIRLGLGVELFQLRIANDISWKPRAGGSIQLISHIQWQPQTELTIHIGAQGSPINITMEHSKGTIQVGYWTLFFRLGFHWKIR